SSSGHSTSTLPMVGGGLNSTPRPAVRVPGTRPHIEVAKPTNDHYDLEVCVATATYLLERDGDDLWATDVIIERRTEVARAVLDVAWPMMAERNARRGDPSPEAGLIALRYPRSPRRRPTGEEAAPKGRPPTCLW